jgi:hypothetical protein
MGPASTSGFCRQEQQKYDVSAEKQTKKLFSPQKEQKRSFKFGKTLVSLGVR